MGPGILDNVRVFEKLKNACFGKAQDNAKNGLVEDGMATKSDLNELENRLVNELRKLELRMTIKLGAMLAAAIAIAAALVKLL